MSDQRDRVTRLLSSLGTVNGPVVLLALMPDGSVSSEIGGKPVAWAVADALHSEGVKVVTATDLGDAYHVAYCEPRNPQTKEGHITPDDGDDAAGVLLFESIGKAEY